MLKFFYIFQFIVISISLSSILTLKFNPPDGHILSTKNRLQRKAVLSVLIAFQFSISPTCALNEFQSGDASLGIEAQDNLESLSVPGRPLKFQEADLLPTIEPDNDNPFSVTLKLIPSYKYFKIISKEYSSRSTRYSGEDNLFAPLQ